MEGDILNVSYHGSDDLFLTGLSYIFHKACCDLDAIIQTDISASVWVLSEEAVTLKWIMSLLDKLSDNEPCFIFGTEPYRRIFNNIPNNRHVCFIDASVSIDDAGMMICANLIRYALTGYFSDDACRNPLSVGEQEIIRLLLQGLKPKDIANKTGLHIKTISAQKRAAMRKLHVKTTMELLVKYRLARF
ncbi:helix-turn-helix domain-containing protein [Enterobacter quasiroggenkampii]|uniref:helix-turn-helix domain-containing protein n=2 Tax=Enterobacter quasiroggenkampii TaxID=2497436 RepID=UPI0021D2AD43|nr:helix-turn-helix transcriptional regulator [Enterobacter quasiroggenkampii]MCU6359045.1 helix-turn-helix transcriptional regulator [Enterobacter quasiroggenkampii]